MIRTLNITRRFSSTILQANRINPRGSEQCETQQHAQLKTNEVRNIPFTPFYKFVLKIYRLKIVNSLRVTITNRICV